MDAILHLLMYCYNSNVQLLQVTLKDISVIEKISLFWKNLEMKCWLQQQAFLRYEKKKKSKIHPTSL